MFIDSVMDFPTLIEFTDISNSDEQLTGLASVIEDPSGSYMAGLPLHYFTGIPLHLLGTKSIVMGNPILANGTSYPTKFLTELADVKEFSNFSEGIFYGIRQIYNDFLLLINGTYSEAEFTNEPLGISLNNNIIAVKQVNSNTATANTVTLDFASNSYVYNNITVSSNFVFRNWGGTRYPLNVPSANTLLFPMPSGTYDVDFAYDANASIYTKTNEVVSNGNYNIPADTKDIDWDKITFVLVP